MNGSRSGARSAARMAALGAIAAATLLACVQENQVTLSFGPKGEGLLGFTCTPSGGGPLILGRAAGTGGLIHLVVDLLPLASDPGGRTALIVSYCSSLPNGCQPLANARTCFDVNLTQYVTDTSSTAAIRGGLVNAFHSLAGRAISTDAPGGPLLVRVVGTTQSCSSLLGAGPPNFTAGALVGCAYGGPAQLDQVRGDLFLGFDDFVSDCEPGVDVCAGNLKIAGF